MHRITPQAFIIVLLLLPQAVTPGMDNGQETRSTLRTTRVDRSINLTGRLDDPLWSQATPALFAYEVQPGDNTPAPQRTEVIVLYTDKYLYFGFRCHDTRPAEIRSNVCDRDKIFQDDHVAVLLDTYCDSQRGYGLAVNPHGIQGDMITTINGDDMNFDMVWLSAASLNDSGWSAEIAIPFKSLRYPDEDEQTWQIHLTRICPRASLIRISWMPLDRNNPGTLSQAGLLAGLKGIPTAGTVELLPYVMGQQTGFLRDGDNPSSGFQNDPIGGRAGGSIQYAPGPDFTLDAVINPDFSQVETDADQISVNSTYALSYAEKRPFFLPGQDLLQTPMYYSRSINNPLVACRVMGKKGGLSYMYLVAFDRNTPFDIPGEDESDTFSTDMQSTANIGRARWDFGDETYAGGMLLARNIEDGHNYVAGMDWSYKFSGNWYFSGETFFSHTKERNDSLLFFSQREFGNTGHTAGFDGESYHGTGLHAVLAHAARHHNANLVYNDFSPTYQAYNGLFSQTDYRQVYLSYAYTLYPESSFVDRAQFSVESNLQYNHAGIQKEQFLLPGIRLLMKGQTDISLSYAGFYDERFRGRLFQRVHKVLFDIATRPLGEVTFTLSGQAGKAIFRSDDPVMGKGYNATAAVEVHPTSTLNLALSYARARLTDFKNGELFYEGYILRSVVGLQFSQEAFFRAIVQYNSFDRTFSVYPLFSYKLNAFSMFYAGSTGDFADYGHDIGFRPTARQYFVKLQYLIRS
jgi:hypothetical protein